MSDTDIQWPFLCLGPTLPNIIDILAYQQIQMLLTFQSKDHLFSAGQLSGLWTESEYGNISKAKTLICLFNRKVHKPPVSFSDYLTFHRI